MDDPKPSTKFPPLLPRPVEASTSSSPTSDRPKAQKRQQVQVACAACQKRKTKCTGERPRCGACERKDTPCLYETEENEPRGAGLKRKNMAMTKENDDFRFLYQTLRTASDAEAHEIVRRMRDRDNVADVVTLIRDTSILLPRMAPSITPSPASQQSSLARHPRSSSDDETVAGKRRKQSVSHLQPSQQPLLSPTQHHRPWQLSSTGSERALSSTTERTSSASSSRHEVPSHVDSPVFNLPATPWTSVSDNPALVSHLVSLYFAWSHPFYNFIDRDAFLSDMVHLQKTYCSPLLVNAILTQACHLSDRLENQLEHARQPNYIGNRFFREAEQLLLAELSHPSLTTLQALLVLTVAACSEGRDAQGWSYVESAVRVAEQMDLLRYNTTRASPTTRGPGGVSTAAANMERSRAITAWGLFTLTSNMVFGLRRPPKLRAPPNMDIPNPHAPDAVDDDATEHAGASGIEPAIRMTFHANCQLAVIVHEIAQALFGSAREGEELIPRQAELFHARLMDWRQNLPDLIKDPSTLRFHYVATLYGFYHVVLQTVLRAAAPPYPDTRIEQRRPSTDIAAHRGAEGGISEPFRSARRAILASSNSELNSLIVSLQTHNRGSECVLYTANLILQAAYTSIDEIRARHEPGVEGNGGDKADEERLMLYATMLQRSGRRWFLYLADLRMLQARVIESKIHVPTPLQELFDGAFGAKDELWLKMSEQLQDMQTSTPLSEESEHDDSSGGVSVEGQSLSAVTSDLEELSLEGE